MFSAAKSDFGISKPVSRPNLKAMFTAIVPPFIISLPASDWIHVKKYRDIGTPKFNEIFIGWELMTRKGSSETTDFKQSIQSKVDNWLETKAEDRAVWQDQEICAKSFVDVKIAFCLQDTSILRDAARWLEDDYRPCHSVSHQDTWWTHRRLLHFSARDRKSGTTKSDASRIIHVASNYDKKLGQSRQRQSEWNKKIFLCVSSFIIDILDLENELLFHSVTTFDA